MPPRHALVYPTTCPHCGLALRPDHDGARPVAAQLLRLALAVSVTAQAASDLAASLGMTRNAVTAGMRRAERAGLVAHTVTSTPHRGGRRYLYAATDLLRAYSSVRMQTITDTQRREHAHDRRGID